MSALWYLASKFLLKKQEGTSTESDPMDVTSISQATAHVFEVRLNELSRSKRVLVVLYPTKKEALAPSPRYLAFRQAARSAMNGCCRWLEVRERAEWSAGHYRDSIHPSAHGNRVLADLIGNALHEAAL